MATHENQGVVLLSRMIAPVAERPRTASNPGVLLVVVAAADGAAGSVGDVTGAGMAVSVAVAGMVGGMKNWNMVAGPMEPRSRVYW